MHAQITVQLIPQAYISLKIRIPLPTQAGTGVLCLRASNKIVPQGKDIPWTNPSKVQSGGKANG